MKRIQFSAILCFALVATTTAMTGCTSLTTKSSLSSKMPWSKKDKKPAPYPNPSRMAATWTPDTLVQTGRTPTRGFGGRLFFYDDKTRAVPVEGELTVHAFAEAADGTQGEVKRYHFTAEQFTEHFSQTDIGASYSVWIPWDAVGGDQMRISLVPSFRSKSGRLVQGEQALVGLPGRRNVAEKIAARPNAATILAAQRGDGHSGLVTTTIPVHSNLGRDRGPSSVPGQRQVLTETLATNKKPTFPASEAAATGPVYQSPAPETFAQGQLGAAAKQAGSTPMEVPETARPLRLGQGDISGGQNVIHASANLPFQ